MESDRVPPMAMEERNRLRKAKLTKTWEHSLWGQILLSIPKHLLKLSILVIIGAFLAMLYLIMSEKDLREFLRSEEGRFDFTSVEVHPLFQHM